MEAPFTGWGGCLLGLVDLPGIEPGSGASRVRSSRPSKPCQALAPSAGVGMVCHPCPAPALWGVVLSVVVVVGPCRAPLVLGWAAPGPPGLVLPLWRLPHLLSRVWRLARIWRATRVGAGRVGCGLPPAGRGSGHPGRGASGCPRRDARVPAVWSPWLWSAVVVPVQVRLGEFKVAVCVDGASDAPLEFLGCFLHFCCVGV